MDQQTDEEAFWGVAPAPAPASPAAEPQPGEADAFWGAAPTASAPDAPGAPHRRPVRTWLAAGVGTVVVAAVGWGGISLARNESTTLAGAAGGRGAGGLGGAGGFR